MRRFRIGIFGQPSSPTDGGSSTLLTALREKVAILLPNDSIEIVPVPDTAWSHRRHLGRLIWRRLLRFGGCELPWVDLRPLCRGLRLDLAYFMAPAFVEIDIPYIFTLWDLGHRTVPDFPEMRSGRDSWRQREALYKSMLPQASFVVTGNEAGAKEAREFYGLSTERLV
ncbi:MAG: hypothetical protein ABIO94_00960, partial [Opitutaceae bacterium]